MKAPQAIVFDLDNTLSRAIEPLSPHVAHGLSKLLESIPVAIMSGASIERVERDVLSTLPVGTKFENLYLFPDTAACCYAYQKNNWQETYRHAFPPGESRRVAKILEEGLRETGIIKGAPSFGERILARDAQVTLAAIGLDAPGDLKAAWDPKRAKRAKLKAFLDPRLPDYDVRISSRTAIDITKKGVDKAEGVRWLAKHLGLNPSDMLFVGDDLKPGGNDAMVIPTGIATRQVSGPDETVLVIDELIVNCRG